MVESFSELGNRPARLAIRDGVIRYFSYLYRNGAFVIRSAEDSPNDPKFRATVTRSHRRTAAALGDRIAKIATKPPQADYFVAGLVVMAMLDHCWLMAQHDEITLMSRDTVLGALTELMFRMLG